MKSNYSLKTFVCKNCGKTVSLRRPQRATTYCSRKCFGEDVKNIRKPKSKKYTSKCEVCNKNFKTTSSTKTTCSKKCYQRKYQQENREFVNSLWRNYYYRKQGYHIKRSMAYIEAHKERAIEINKKATFKYRDRTRFGGKTKEVFEHYKNKCFFCGGGNRLAIHHIDGNGRRSKNPNNTLSNLVLLCSPCHTKLHARIRRMKRKSDTLSN